MNKARPNAWPYRDWVIESLNDDMPYDQFVREQLVGERPAPTPPPASSSAARRTASKSPDPVLTANQRADELHDMVGTTGSAFLGLTVGCARCHDHKFDPIKQTDYYAMTAVFAGVSTASGRSAARQRGRAATRGRRGAATAGRAAAAAGRTAAGCRLTPDARDRRRDDRPDELLAEPSGVANPCRRVLKPRPARREPAAPAALPNLGKQYHWWAGQGPTAGHSPTPPGPPAGFASGCPGEPAGQSHSPDARYLLDADGDPATTNDQTEIAQIDQRLSADGSGQPAAPAGALERAVRCWGAPRSLSRPGCW